MNQKPVDDKGLDEILEKFIMDFLPQITYTNKKHRAYKLAKSSLNAYYQKKYLELAEELVDNSLQALVIIGNNEYLNGGYINIVELREALANMEKE